MSKGFKDSLSIIWFFALFLSHEILSLSLFCCCCCCFLFNKNVLFFSSLQNYTQNKYSSLFDRDYCGLVVMGWIFQCVVLVFIISIFHIFCAILISSHLCNCKSFSNIKRCFAGEKLALYLLVPLVQTVEINGLHNLPFKDNQNSSICKYSMS